MKKILLILALFAAPFLNAQTVTDTFSGTGVIGSPNWTTSVCSGYSTLSKTSGLVQATTASTQGIIVYTGQPFSSNQGGQVLIPATVGSAGDTTGPIINMDTTCTGYIWVLANNTVIHLINGSFHDAAPSAICPSVVAGDSPQLYRSGNDLHCKNGAIDINVWTDFSSLGGQPGLIVDNRTSSVRGLSTFTGTGVVLPTAATPTSSPAPGYYATTQSVSLACTTPSPTILYGLNGAPVTSTYTTALTVSTTTTIQFKCTASGYQDSAVVTVNYHIGGGNLSSITLCPPGGCASPTDGYHIATNTGTIQLVAQCHYSNGFSDDDCVSSGYPLIWGGTDDTIFTVNASTGLATGSGPGADYISGTVYAYYASILGQHVVYMDSSVPTSLVSRPEGSYSDVVIGSTVLVSVMDGSGGSVSGNPLGQYAAYTSANPAVASVNNIGEVTGVSVGSTTITALYYGLTVGRTVNVVNPSSTFTTYYVRPNGGTRTQCTGLSNVDYPGSGSGVACAVNNPMYCFTDESSSSTYTGLVQAGDICQIANGTTPYRMGTKSTGVAWITNDGNAISPPSGTAAHHTTTRGENYASCTSPRFGVGNRAQVWAYHVDRLFDLRGVQNFDMQCVNDDTYQDCNTGLNSDLDFSCGVGGGTEYGLMVNDFTANANITTTRFNGFQTCLVGTSGPGLVIDHTQCEGSYLAGWNYDNPFGYSGNQQDTIDQNYVDTSFAGFTTDLPHSISAASIDGSGHLNVTFSSTLNYVTGTQLVLTGMTPIQFNGTFPVTSVTFNQQTASITGGSCDVIGSSQGSVIGCIFNTSAPPAFGIGAIVNISGATSNATIPGFMNGVYEVWNVSGSTFQVNASAYTRPGWQRSAVTVSSGGTASTANSLVATLAGGAATASVLGQALHVYNFHRGMDAGGGGNGNGDCIGSGIGTLGDSLFDHINVFSCSQDGLDQLHATINNSSVTNSTAINTSGAGFKFGNATNITFKNNLAVIPCAWSMAFNPNLPPEWNQYLAQPCRAGAATGIEARMWTKMVVSNNTWLTNFGVAINIKCDDTNGCNLLPTVGSCAWQNGLFNGFLDTNDPAYSGSLPNPYYQGNSNTLLPCAFLNNMGYNVGGGPGGGSNNWTATNSFTTTIPNISSFSTESNTLTWNANLATSTPAIGFGVHNTYTPTTDINGLTRPNPPSAGSFDVGAPTLVSMTVGNVTVAVSGTATPSCVATYSDSSTGVCFSPVWNSATPSVATINSSTGLVTGVSAGTSAITAVIGPITSSPGTATVTATPAGLLTLRGHVLANGNITFR